MENQTLWTNGWFGGGGGKKPPLFLVQHPFMNVSLKKSLELGGKTTLFLVQHPYLDPPRVSNFSPQVCFWWLRGSNFRPLEDSGMYSVVQFIYLWDDYLPIWGPEVREKLAVAQADWNAYAQVGSAGRIGPQDGSTDTWLITMVMNRFRPLKGLFP